MKENIIESTKRQLRKTNLPRVSAIIMLIAGIALIAMPAIGSLAVNYIIAFFLLVSSVSHFASLGSKSNRVMHTILALTALAAAGAFIFLPSITLLYLTLFLGVLIAVHGVARLYLAFQLEKRRLFHFFGALLSLALAVVVFASLPESSLVFPGILLGVDLIIGAFMIFEFSSQKQLFLNDSDVSRAA